MTELFQRGLFTLASGAESNYKIEFDALGPESIECLAELIAERVGKFRRCYGVPTGSLQLADALDRRAESYRATELPILVVDDVWTTGGSMQRYIKQLKLEGYQILRAVVFAREAVPANVMALFQMCPKAIR